MRHKFNAIRTEIDGIKFASKKEGRYWADLVLARKAGDLLFALRQIPISLPGGITYRVDFLEFWANGECRFVEVKGHKTRVYINKKKQVEALYPIKIIEV